MLVYPTGIPTGASGYTIKNAIWLDGSSDYLNKTFSGTGTNRKKFTFSCWFKLGALGATGTLLSCDDTSSDKEFMFWVQSDGTIRIANYEGGTNKLNLITSRVLRDPTAWTHLLLSANTDGVTPSVSTIKLYINGVQIQDADLSTNTYPAQDFEFALGNSFDHEVGRYALSNNNLWNGYIAEMVFIDGNNLDSTDFGELDDNGVWIPKNTSGLGFGTNGFHLDFEVAPGTGNGAGTDVSGNGNHFTDNSMTTAQKVTDTPTDNASSNIGNYATWNPISDSTISSSGVAALSDGNLTATSSSGAWKGAESTINLPASGKIGFELTMANEAQDGFNYPYIGIAPQGDTSNAGSVAWVYGFQGYNGNMVGSGVSGSLSGGGLSANDVVELLIDIDDGTAEIKVNGTSEKTDSSLTFNNSHCLRVELYSYALTADFGQSGYNPSESDHKTLNTANLPAPTVTKPDDFFKTVLYTGNGGTKAVTGVGFQPDFLWIKSRSIATNWNIYDAVRTANSMIRSNSANGEQTGSDNELSSFDADGFTVTHAAGVVEELNQSSGTYVAYCLKANGTGVSNTDGNVTGGSTVSVASHNGFAIVTYPDCGGAAKTIGHGMGKAPDMIMVKTITGSTRTWRVYHKDLTSEYVLYLNTVEPQASETASFGTIGTSTFGVDGGSGTSASGETHVAYCFARTPGLIAVGSFEGANAADGSNIVLDDGASGFKPGFFMFKNMDANGDWYTFDSTRNTYNPVNSLLALNQGHNESTMASNSSNGTVDFTANGVKFRSTNGSDFQGANTFIYLAFAENPFGGEDVAQAKAR